MHLDNMITNIDELRKPYPKPTDKSIIKEKDYLDNEAKDFIAASPFICLSTSNPEGYSDCSPKGDPAGFVKVLDQSFIAIPDRQGNNRLDSMSNILKNPNIGILFFIPNRLETLRINGLASLSRDDKLLESLKHQDKLPCTAIVVEVKEVYLHCPKALIRSKLWQAGQSLPSLSSYIKMMSKQLNEKRSEDELLQLEKEYISNLKHRLY